MSTKMMKQGEIKDQTSAFDQFKFFVKYKNHLLSLILITTIIIIVIVVSIKINKSKQEDAWASLSKYLDPSYPIDSITESTINEILSSAEGTSAEPWAMYYCTTIFIRNRNFKDAEQILNKLNTLHKNHYIYSNSTLPSNSNSIIEKELKWDINKE